MERVGLERRAAPEGAREQAPPPVPRMADILALQRTAGNQAVTRMLSQAPRTAVQRALDADFPHAGKPTADELDKAQRFAEIVSGIVDQAHSELMGGRVGDWKGAKIATFIDLLRRPSTMAVTHAGNAIEERVYHLMKDATLPCKWTPQFAEGMGGASKPDIVAHVSEDHDALIDVTSDRYHIYGKAGGWMTSARYVYVAEAFFPSVVAEHLPHILEALDKGGVDDAAVAKLRKEVEAQREAREKERRARLAAARKRYNQYKSVKRLADAEFGGHRPSAEGWMRENGLGGMKGVKKLKGGRKPSAEAKAAAKQKARKLAYKAKKVEKRKAQEKEEAAHDLRADEVMKRRKGVVAEAEPDEELEELPAEDEEFDEGGYDDEEAALGMDDEDEPADDDGHEEEDEEMASL